MKINLVNLLGVIILSTAIACDSGSNTKEITATHLSGIPEVDKITRLLEKKPENAQLFFQRAEVYYNNELFDLANKDSQRAIRIDSTKWEYHHLLADGLLDNAQSKKSLNVLEDFLKIRPNRIGTLLKLSEFQYILRQYEDAKKTISRIVQIDPQESEAYFMLGHVFLESGDTSSAINSYQTSVEMNSSNTDAWLMIGNLLVRQGNRNALKYIENGLAVQPGSVALLQSKGNALQHFGDFNGALLVFDEILKSFPQNAEVHFNKGVVYLKMGLLDLSEKSFRIAQQLSPANYIFYLNLGVILEQQGKLKEALLQYEQAVKLGGANDSRVKESIILINAKLQDEL